MIDRLIQALPFKSVIASFGLQRREKIIVAAGAAAVAVLLLLQLVIFPIVDRRTRLAARIVLGMETLGRIEALKSEYLNLTRTAQLNDSQIKNRSSDFTLFSFLEGLAGQGGIKQNIVYMKPSTTNLKNSSHVLSSVEMKIDGLTTEQLVGFMRGVETSGQMVWIKRLSIAKGEKADSLLNAVLQVETLVL